MKAYRAFFAKYLPGSDISEAGYLLGYSQGVVLEQILKQCGDDLSRENIVKQAKSLNNFKVPVALPGITVNTTATVNQNRTQMRLHRCAVSKCHQLSVRMDT